MIDFIHISDTHFGPTRDMDIRGTNPYQRNRALVDAINGLPFTPKFIVHTGDIVNDPDDDAYHLAEEVLGELKSPIHYVSGNHDSVRSAKKFMTCAWHKPLEGVVDKMAYSFDMGDDVTGIAFDAWVPEEEGPHGFVPEDQALAMDQLLSSQTSQRFALFLHYPVIPIGSPWIDQTLLVKNGEAVHQLLRKYRDRCCGVFFGHLHRGLHLYRDGILYSGVSSPICHFSCGPEQTEGCDFDPNCALPFNHVSISSEATMVKEYALPTC